VYKRTSMLNYFRLFLISCLAAASSLLAQTGAISSIRISTVPSGARFYVDGLPYVAAQVFLWPQGSKHIVQFPIDFSNGVSTHCQVSQSTQYKYCFSNWTDSSGLLSASNAPDQTVTASPSITWKQANLTVSYQVRIRFGDYAAVPEPACAAPGDAPQDATRPGLLWVGGVCLLTGSDIYAAGVLTLNAFPFPGFVFTAWNINGQTFDAYLKSYTVTGPVTISAGFEPAKRVKFVSSPSGMKLLIDRTPTPTSASESRDFISANFPPCKASLNLPPMPPISVPALCFGEFDFLPGSRHVVGAVSPQLDNVGKYWVLDRFSNGLEANSLYVADSNTAVADVITAQFVPAVQAAFLTTPSGLKLNVDGRENWPSYNFIWASNSTHTVAAPPTQMDSNGRTWTFQGWSNGGAAAQSVIMDAGTPNVRLAATYTSLGLLKVLTNPPGLTLRVEGVDCTSPCTVDRTGGTQVSIAAPTSVPIDGSSRLDWLGWSDGAPAVRSFTLNGEAQTIFANYGYSYRLTVASDPPGAVDFRLSPSTQDLFFPTDTPVTVTAVARAGFRFRRWDFDLAGVYNVGQVVVSGPRSVLAMADRIPYIAPAGIQNAAGHTPDGTVAPGSIITIYGESLAPQIEVGPTNPLAQTIAGVVVTVNDRILPLLFVSPEQINAQLLSDMPAGDYTLTVRWTGKTDVTGTFTIARNAPGLFSRFADPQPYSMAAHEDGSQVTPTSPAQEGELVSVFGTGFGPYDRKIVDGFSVSNVSAPALIDVLEVETGTLTIQPEWSGAAAGFVGVDITKFRVPEGISSTNVELRVKVNGRPSNTVILPVQ
jgi:uncharacterized protein (TIGR03437 family)